MRMRRLRRGRGRGHRRHHPHPHRPTSNGLLHHPRHHLRRRLSHRRLILLLRHRHVRIRPLVSRSRSRRRRARASHRRSRRSRRHRRRHHRSGMSHTITPSAHRRSLSRNHPPRPSSTVARIVISHHESTMTMRGGANETRVRSRLRVPLSLSLSRVVDRSFDRVSMPPFASRPSRTPVLARARQSHPITCNSFITRARRAVLAGIDRLDGPARAPFHIHTQTPIDRSNKKNNHHTHNKK